MNAKNIKISVVIAAAGKGTRAKLPYPKCLFSIQGKPILGTIMDNTFSLDRKPTLIVSKEGLPHIKNFLIQSNRKADILIQENQIGMGNAVLQISKKRKDMNEDILLSWGDLPFIPQSIFEDLCAFHIKNKNDFSIATYHSKNAYTYVIRDDCNNLKEVIESKEMYEKNLLPLESERDIGVFVFKKDLLLDFLDKELPDKYGKVSNEHGFLYIIKHLVASGYKVESLPVKEEMSEVSFNSFEDIKDFI
ncbi:NTP transferase domain-containing protein [Gammaproteobacteria bacterium]|jgi:bifunctional N-acetylglucosamine-1-phosphate-uridyltransferase/glucosamine-1-phosphate-acetyltransferase GlmU-like protein|nr:NTP transferase domain-containing protein [Gammaproteobacteria bacterium]MDC0129007.1 NTP transferase domain-containing protein [Gammaproteobacteria bacterium]